MIRIIVSEYLEKMWIHFFIVMLLTTIMLASGALLGEISVRNSMYDSVMDNIDEQAILIATNYDEEKIGELENKGKLIINKEYFAVDKRQKDLEQNEKIRVRACPDEIMENMIIRLDAGKTIDECVNKDIISVYITHNNLGIDAGDTITLCVDVGDGKNEIETDVYIAGVLSEGQKIYGFDGFNREFNYTNMFQTYSYKQLGEILMVTSQKEMSKLKDSASCSYDSGIFQFNDDISAGQADIEKEKIIQYEKERNFGISFVERVFPDMETFINNSKELYFNELKKYIPMLVCIVLMGIMCLIGITSIKIDMNLSVYTLFYLCGMRMKKVIMCNAFEMLTNVIFANVLYFSVVVIQNHLELFGRINLINNSLTIMSVESFCVLAVLCTIAVSYVIVKKHTPVQIMKSRM